ncbi:MAG: ABC transporter ATP-binding protein [bacterium]
MTWDIEISGATVSYREHIALKNISLRIEAGSFTAAVGPNGAGKTTLLTLINGLGKLQRGTVKIFGTLVTVLNRNKFRKEIGYVPQQMNIDVRMPISVYDIIMLGRYSKIGLFRNPGKRDYTVVDNICQLVGIDRLLGKPIGHLSGGEMQKVSIARALAQEPRILLLDEPTANLDPCAQHEIVELIERIYGVEKITIIFVTHLINHLPNLCTDALLLKGGHIIASGGIHKVFTKDLLSKVYDFDIEPPKMDSVL